jgi:hypothetical protein
MNELKRHAEIYMAEYIQTRLHWANLKLESYPAPTLSAPKPQAASRREAGSYKEHNARRKDRSLSSTEERNGPVEILAVEMTFSKGSGTPELALAPAAADLGT